MSKIIKQTYDDNGKPSTTYFEDGMDIFNPAEEPDYELMYERALGEIERLVLRIQELENQLERTRQNNMSMAYTLAGRVQ